MTTTGEGTERTITVECSCCAKATGEAVIVVPRDGAPAVGFILPAGWRALLYPNGIVEFSCEPCHTGIDRNLRDRQTAARQRRGA